MGLFAKLKAYAGVMSRGQRPMETLALLRKRPVLLVGVNVERFPLGLLSVSLYTRYSFTHWAIMNF